jgi:hypothetical protein
VRAGLERTTKLEKVRIDGVGITVRQAVECVAEVDSALETGGQLILPQIVELALGARRGERSDRGLASFHHLRGYVKAVKLGALWHHPARCAYERVSVCVWVLHDLGLFGLWADLTATLL